MRYTIDLTRPPTPFDSTRTYIDAMTRHAYHMDAPEWIPSGSAKALPDAANCHPYGNCHHRDWY